MVKLLQNKSDFPPGLTSLTNIQRQFFDSFVGQTFQVVPASSFQLQMPTRICGDSARQILFFEIWSEIFDYNNKFEPGWLRQVRGDVW